MTIKVQIKRHPRFSSRWCVDVVGRPRHRNPNQWLGVPGKYTSIKKALEHFKVFYGLIDWTGEKGSADFQYELEIDKRTWEEREAV